MDQDILRVSGQSRPWAARGPHGGSEQTSRDRQSAGEVMNGPSLVHLEPGQGVVPMQAMQAPGVEPIEWADLPHLAGGGVADAGGDAVAVGEADAAEGGAVPASTGGGKKGGVGGWLGNLLFRPVTMFFDQKSWINRSAARATEVVVRKKFPILNTDSRCRSNSSAWTSSMSLVRRPGFGAILVSRRRDA